MESDSPKPPEPRRSSRTPKPTRMFGDEEEVPVRKSRGKKRQQESPQETDLVQNEMQEKDKPETKGSKRKENGEPTSKKRKKKSSVTEEKAQTQKNEQLVNLEQQTYKEFSRKILSQEINQIKCFEYEDELKKMMYSFGDSKNPDMNSIHLMEILAQIFVKNLLEAIVSFFLSK